MSDSNGTVFFAVLIWVFTISISIFAGILAWNWIEPESFLGAIGFIFLWGILTKIGHLISMGLIALLSGE